MGRFLRKLQLATDFYQFSVCNVYYETGMADNIAVFDLFIRKNPFNGGYTVFSGLERIVEFIESLSFEEEDLAMLKENHPEFSEGFLDYLRNFKFSGEIYAMREGTIVFPQQPLVRVTAPLIQAQLLETTLLAFVNHEALIATKASRVCYAARGDAVIDFGLRRAHGTEAGLFGARSAILGGCIGTSNVEAEYRFGVVSKGTMSHAYVMSFDSEQEAFRRYADINPGNVTCLVDTYNTLRSGVPNAIVVFEELREKGELFGNYGIRLDSGDLAYLSKESRKMLDDAGFFDAKITASSDLDEYLIYDLKSQGAKIDFWGVGTKMITAYDNPSLGGVYKLSEIRKDGRILPKMKLSNDPFKVTNPCCKKVVRCIDDATGKATADLIMIDDEVIDTSQPLKIYHPYYSYKQRTIKGFSTMDLLQCIYKDGELVYELEPLQEARAYHESQKSLFWDTVLRFVNPEEYHVDYSDKLYDIKKELFAKARDEDSDN